MNRFIIGLALVLASACQALAFDNWVSCATGNFDTSTTWCKTDTTSYQNLEGAPTALNATNGTSSAFTPGAITIKGIAVKLAVVANSAGTVKIELVQAGSSVAGTPITLNCADLPSATQASDEGGWVVTNFANVLLVGATAYNVKITTASSCNLSFYTDGTASNWSRMLVTSTTGSPATADNMVVSGQYTGQGTNTPFTVTMNHNAATALGTGTGAIAPLAVVDPVIAVVNHGTLAYANAATQLKLAGNIVVYNGGIFSQGTSGTPIALANASLLQLVSSTDGDFGLVCRNGSSCTSFGTARGAGNFVRTTLTSTASVNATTLNVNDATNWPSGDQIAIPSTIAGGGTNNELGALNGAAGATSLTVNGFAGAGGGVAFTHTVVGTTLTVPVINITRNVKINNGSAAGSGATAYVYCAATATCDFEWTEFFNLGANLAGRKGIVTDTTSGTFTLKTSSIHDTKNFCLTIGETQSAWAGHTIQHVVVWNGATTLGPCMNNPTQSTAAAPYVIDDLTIVQTGNGFGGSLNSGKGQFTNIDIRGSGSQGLVVTASGDVTGTWGPIILASNASFGTSLNGSGTQITISGFYVYLNGNTGLGFSGFGVNLVADPAYFWGNGNGAGVNITFQGSNDLTLRNGVMAGAAANGNNINVALDNAVVRLEMDNMVLDSGTSPYARAVNDIGALFIGTFQVYLRGTTVNPTAAIVQSSFPTATGLTNSSPNSFVCSDALSQCWVKTGELIIDSVITHTAANSIRMTPYASAVHASAVPGNFGGFIVPVAANVPVQVCVYIRTSVIGDAGGANYNGSAPILVQKANPLLLSGGTTDTTLATFSGATGTWTQSCAMSSTPTAAGALTFVVKATGNASPTGWVNVTDWGSSGGPSTGAGYWVNGAPLTFLYPGQGSGGYLR